MKPEGTFQTPIGNATYTMTAADHVYLRVPDAVINRVDYSVAFHCHLIGGVWKEPNWNEPFLNRRDHKEPSYSARTKAREVLRIAWADHLNGRPEMSRQAEIAKIEEEVKRIESEIDDLKANLKVKYGEWAKAKARLDKLICK